MNGMTIQTSSAPWSSRWAMKLVALVALVAFGASCSTYTSIRSDPDGAKVYMNGTYVGETPLQTEVADGFYEADYNVRLTLPGYEDQTSKLRQDLQVGLLVLDGVVCILTVGVGCALAVVNGQRHRSEYRFTMNKT